MRMRVWLLVLGLVAAACDGPGSSSSTAPSSGPDPARGLMIVSTATEGEVPDTDGYLLVVDTTPLRRLAWRDTARLAVPLGHHTLRLRGVPARCSVEPDTTVAVTVTLQDTLDVRFSTTCPTPTTRIPPTAMGYVRISVNTTGTVSDSARYDVWYDHYDYWGYGGAGELLGNVGPDGTLPRALPASHLSSGSDPYWYNFWLGNLPSGCLPRNATLQMYRITPGDTLYVTLTVTCAP